MKKTFAVFLLAALTLTVLAGCQSANAENTVPDSLSATSLIPQDQYEGQITKTDAPEAVLSAREAEAAALAHAGIKAEDARMERTELDRDEKLPHYEVEFSSGDYEYDYEINAATGEVLHWDKEYDPPKPAPTTPPATEPPVTQPEATLLTAKEAEAAALAHAGIKAEDARMERTELDQDEKIPHYEVEFSNGDYEYDYEINAATGEVLHWDKEYDPPKPAPTAPPATQPPVTQPESTLLTEEEAEAAALAHAGLAAGEVRFDRTEKDREKGVPVYEVEFQAGNWEYSYEIHAETGKILEWEKEFDD